MRMPLASTVACSRSWFESIPCFPPERCLANVAAHYPTGSNIRMTTDRKVIDLPDEPMGRLLAVMARLRNPDGGCPWDLEQDFRTIAPYTIEEAYEVADAIEHQDMASLQDELGDLLLQVVFHAQMAREAGSFAFDDVARAIAEKMIRRHPHVFGTVDIKTADAQTLAWEEHKQNERAAKAIAEGRRPSVLDGVAVGLPALMRALKLQRRAARVGFDWPNAADVLVKIDEELIEIKQEISIGRDAGRMQD